MNHRLPGQVTRILLFSLLALQLGACSSTRLSYQFADRGVVWWVEDYVALACPVGNSATDVPAFRARGV